MSVDGFSNAYSTTLNGALDNSQTTLVVTSATGAPSTVPFRLRIGAESSNANEIVTVTAVAGTTFTITRASEAYAGVQTASAHASGAIVEHVLTAGGLMTISSLASASYKRTSGNYTTSSTTLVDVDGTNFSHTITTGARRVLVGFVGTIYHDTTLASTILTVLVDGTNIGGSSGIVQARWEAANGNGISKNASFTFMTDVLTAGSHTFKLQWYTTTGTTLMFGSSASTESQFWVMEQNG